MTPKVDCDGPVASAAQLALRTAPCETGLATAVEQEHGRTVSRALGMHGDPDPADVDHVHRFGL
jgi:hypothetical protein